MSLEIDSDCIIKVKTPSRHTSTGSRPETSSRATSSAGENDSSADVVSYRYGGFAPDDDVLVERQDINLEGFEKGRKQSTAPSRYKARSNSFHASTCLTFRFHSLSPRSRRFTQRHHRILSSPIDRTRKRFRMKTYPKVPKAGSRKTCFHSHWIRLVH